jgi:hypothetical protein
MLDKHIQTIISKEYHEKLIVLALRKGCTTRNYLKELVIQHIDSLVPKEGVTHGQEDCSRCIERRP